MKKTLILIGTILLTIGTIGLSWMALTPHIWETMSAIAMGGEYLGRENVVLQTTRNNCGPSALTMVLHYAGILISVEELERRIPMSDQGTTMMSLKEAAERFGISVEGWRLTYDDLRRKPLPALLFINDGHFVVADSADSGRIYLRDPGIGRIAVRKEAFLQQWKGETLLFQF